jgi:monoamine oxidase
VSGPLSNVEIFVVGAGLAGLTAARHLASRGARVTVADARERVGGRVWTIREPFEAGQHAESGGDMIDPGQHAIQNLCKEVGLELTSILGRGWGYVRLDASGRPRRSKRPVANGWRRLSAALHDEIRSYRLVEKRWDSPITVNLARQSVASWLDRIGADAELRDTAIGMRGFFLADVADLSLVALVDQFASSAAPVDWRTYRIKGGNDRLPARLAADLGDRLLLRTQVVAVDQRRRRIRISLENRRAQSQVAADYVLFATPTTLLRRIEITPALPASQHEAIRSLKYGHGTKTLLQFSRAFWRQARRPAAYGSPLSFGALWDGNEKQRGRPGILSLLAGGQASDETQTILSLGGAPALVRELGWLGPARTKLLASHSASWERDRWSRGGYAFFDPAFDPALRPWLARPAGRLFFAGEHTSLQWQGYMNGAVESGLRAAEEIEAVHYRRG